MGPKAAPRAGKRLGVKWRLMKILQVQWTDKWAVADLIYQPDSFPTQKLISCSQKNERKLHVNLNWIESNKINELMEFYFKLQVQARAKIKGKRTGTFQDPDGAANKYTKWTGGCLQCDPSDPTTYLEIDVKINGLNKLQLCFNFRWKCDK